MTDNPLTLFCLVEGETSSRAFSVKIPLSSTVDDLKDLIKAKIPDTFNGVDAKDLTVWRVSHRVIAANKHQPVLLSGIDSVTELASTDDISKENNPRHRPTSSSRKYQGGVLSARIIYAFHKKQLKHELFSIPKPAVHKNAPNPPLPQFEPVTFPRHMFKHPATIVGWEGYEWGARYRPNLTMGDFLEAHYKHGSKRGGSKVPPFFYPELSPSGPDIVFVLQINNELYPVFVQTKCLAGIFPGGVEKPRLTIHESRIKDHLPNLAMYCPGGKYLSLIYVHPTINKTLRKGWERDNLWDTDSESGANSSHTSNGSLMQLLMIIDGENMRDFVPRGVVDLLDSVKGTKRVGDQTSSSGRAKKKKKSMREKQ
ncbi:hypothetical protein EDD11_002979 [Mortierella claussenii]|nr:hypothetical protein EDD11_002979 [Mortierella claussenii]